MHVFTPAELEYLRGEGRLGRVATVGHDGTPHLTPVGMWSYNQELGTIDIRGRDFGGTKKFRDVMGSGGLTARTQPFTPPTRMPSMK